MIFMTLAKSEEDLVKIALRNIEDYEKLLKSIIVLFVFKKCY